MFTSTYNRGFHLTFENGITISVQFGTGNYCERRDFHSTMDVDLKNTTTKSKDAEIAIWDAASQFKFESDTVKGWCSTDEVAEWIHKAANATFISDIQM